MNKISNWGNYPAIQANVIEFESEERLKNTVRYNTKLIARGLGRCYGDSALSETIVSTNKFKKILNFDSKKAELTCESGLSIGEILEEFVPKGFFIPVTPGTKYVTIGGAIASDVHGKNHHKEGSFSNHLISFDLMDGEGKVLHCSRKQNPEVFWSTCGGMGLTGIILRATFRMKKVESAYIKQDSIRVENLDELLNVLEESNKITYTVSWIDCLSKGKSLGRGIAFLGEHATRKDLKGTSYEKSPFQIQKKLRLTVPFFLPSFTLNKLTISIFNFLMFHKHFKKKITMLMDWDTFFYPLDVIHHWNRIYGKNGFTQYQLVIPFKNGREGLKKIVQKISDSGFGSFLAVLKTFKDQDNYIAFPEEGYTLTLDFPVSEKLFRFLDELDQIVLQYGGRLYLTKDVRMNEAMFTKGYKNRNKFVSIKKKTDKAHKFESLQSRRIGV